MTLELYEWTLSVGRWTCGACSATDNDHTSVHVVQSTHIMRTQNQPLLLPPLAINAIKARPIHAPLTCYTRHITFVINYIFSFCSVLKSYHVTGIPQPTAVVCTWVAFSSYMCTSCLSVSVFDAKYLGNYRTTGDGGCLLLGVYKKVAGQNRLVTSWRHVTRWRHSSRPQVCVYGV